MCVLSKHKLLLASIIAAVSNTGFVYAAGFGLNEFSSSYMGSAYAGRASNPEDASIGAYNPAGIGFLKHKQIVVGGAFILKAGNFKGEYTHTGSPTTTGTAKNFLHNTIIPFGHFYTPVNDQVGYALNVYAPNGLNLRYDDNFVGKYLGLKTMIQNINVQNTFSYKPTENVSVGIGLTLSYLRGTLTQTDPLSEGEAVVKGQDTAPTWSAGTLWRITPNNAVGISYQAPSIFNLKGTVSLKNTAIGFQHDATLAVTMPEHVIGGFTHKFNDRWTAMTTIMWTRWSRLKTLLVEDKVLPITNQLLPVNWRNVWAFSIGTSYQLNDDWTLKTGYMFDESPTTNSNRVERAPDGNRNWFTVGAHWRATQNVSMDFTAAYVRLNDGAISQQAYNPDGTINPAIGTLTGEYINQSTALLSAQLNYRF